MHTKRFLSIVFLLLLILIFATSLEVQQFIERSFLEIRDYVSVHQVIGAGLFLLIASLSAMLSPFSAVPFVPIAVLTWGPVISIFLLLAGWVLGGCFAFFLSRWIGQHILRKFISFETIDHYIEVLPKKLGFEILLLFRLAVPAEIPGYVMGLTAYPFFPYFAATLLAEIPFAIISVYASEAFLEKQFLPLATWIFVAVMILALTFHILRKILPDNKKEPPMM